MFYISILESLHFDDQLLAEGNFHVWHILNLVRSTQIRIVPLAFGTTPVHRLVNTGNNFFSMFANFSLGTSGIATKWNG